MFQFVLLIVLLTSTVNHSFIESNSNVDLTYLEYDSLYASIQFDTKFIEHYNFCEGEIQTYSYRFMNTGKVPLVITQVRSGCGCYVPYWSREPILPGDSGTVSGRYSSLYRPGPFRRSLTVFFKDDLVPRQMLHVKGYTVPRAICR